MVREYAQSAEKKASASASAYPNATKLTSAPVQNTAPPPPQSHATARPFFAYGMNGHPPPPPGYEAGPPSHSIPAENGHRAPGPYTTAQYETKRGPPRKTARSLYHAPHAPARSPGSSPSHVQHARDPPPPHYAPIHGPPQDHTRPSPPPGFPPYREEHRPTHWPGHPEGSYAGAPPPRFFDSSQRSSYSNAPPIPPPPPPAQSYPPQPPPSDHGHTGPYRYSDPTLRRQARILGPSERFNDVDGREGATSPSQIESSHRDEVTTMGCTCKKTKCLKLYCQCFAVKIYCGGNCRCLICKNTVKFEKERKDAIRSILSRNPSAFDTKFKKTGGGGGGGDRVVPDKAVVDTQNRILAHKLGCKCRKSACMKKYCECYAGNVKCSANCRCVGCKNMPPGGLGPGPGPEGVPLISREASSTSSEEDVEEPVVPTVKPREPWMMSAAQNLAFLKHASHPPPKQRRANASEEVASMPSLASEHSPGERKSEDAKTVSVAGASEIPEPSSSEKAAVNALLIAAMAMTEMSGGNSRANTPSKSESSPAVVGAFETPPKVFAQRALPLPRDYTKKGDSNPSSMDDEASREDSDSRTSPAVSLNNTSDEDSPKREFPDDITSCNQHKIKRSRIGSLKKGTRNIGNALYDEYVPRATQYTYNSYQGVPVKAEKTPDTKAEAKIGDLTPVSARCIDFRRMNVNGSSASNGE